MRLGKTLLTATPKSWIDGPKTRIGRRASVSAERPTTNSANVNTAVKNGDENEENNVATPVTIATSHMVNTPKPTSTRRSSGAPAARPVPTTARNVAQAIGK